MAKLYDPGSRKVWSCCLSPGSSVCELHKLLDPGLTLRSSHIKIFSMFDLQQCHTAQMLTKYSQDKARSVKMKVCSKIAKQLYTTPSCHTPIICIDSLSVEPDLEREHVFPNAIGCNEKELSKRMWAVRGAKRIEQTRVG